jgi:hypothetical protein
MLEINFIWQGMANLIAISFFTTAFISRSPCLITEFIAKHNKTKITAPNTLSSPHMQHSRSENMSYSSPKKKKQST